MTTLKKNTLALALFAAMGFAANANAYSVAVDPTAPTVAKFDIIDDSTVIAVTGETITVSLDDSASEGILGRTTGFTLVLTLDQGAEFAADPTVTIGADNGTWTTSVIAGGAGANFVTVKFDEASPPTGLAPGDLVVLSNISLTNLVDGLQAGGSIKVHASLVDPVTNKQLYTVEPTDEIVLLSDDPVALSCDTDYGNTSAKIDVGTNDGDYMSKATFSYSGAINDGGYYYFDAGRVFVDTNPDIPTFQYLADDEFTTVVTGTFSGFDAVTMVDECGGNDIAGTISDDGTTVTFEYTGADLATAYSGCWDVMFHAPGDTVLGESPVVSEKTTFVRPDVGTSVGDDCALLPIRYNGSVVRVETFNPAGNTTQQSFLRITNPSVQGGKVTIVGTDDSGTESTPVSFDLAAGESVQINSDVLEMGGTASGGHELTGGLGDGDGKWRLVITGEFANMRVSSLNRNNTTGTVTNLTDYDSRGEQAIKDFFDNY